MKIEQLKSMPKRERMSFFFDYLSNGKLMRSDVLPLMEFSDELETLGYCCEIVDPMLGKEPLLNKATELHDEMDSFLLQCKLIIE